MIALEIEWWGVVLAVVIAFVLGAIFLEATASSDGFRIDPEMTSDGQTLYTLMYRAGPEFMMELYRPGGSRYVICTMDDAANTGVDHVFQWTCTEYEGGEHRVKVLKQDLEQSNETGVAK